MTIGFNGNIAGESTVRRTRRTAITPSSLEPGQRRGTSGTPSAKTGGGWGGDRSFFRFSWQQPFAHTATVCPSTVTTTRSRRDRRRPARHDNRRMRGRLPEDLTIRKVDPSRGTAVAGWSSAQRLGAHHRRLDARQSGHPGLHDPGRWRRGERRRHLGHGRRGRDLRKRAREQRRTGFGGGIWLDGASGTVRNNQIRGNTRSKEVGSRHGRRRHHAKRTSSTTITARRRTTRRTATARAGGGIFLRGAAALVDNDIFRTTPATTAAARSSTWRPGGARQPRLRQHHVGRWWRSLLPRSRRASRERERGPT